MSKPMDLDDMLRHVAIHDGMGRGDSRELIAECKRLRGLADAVRGFLEDTDDESKDIDFLWAAWKMFNGERQGT